MSHIDKSAFKEIESRLRRNQEARLKRGALYQDFDFNGCFPGEIFYSNLTQEQFDALPLKCKRKGGPARTTRVFSETYEKLYQDKDSFAVYLHTYELDLFGIKYK